MRTPPLAVILEWPKPDYDNPATRGPALLIVNLVFVSLVVLAVTGRFYSRIVVKKWYGIDDTMIAFALFFTLGLNISVILANQYYCWNRHVWDIPFDMLAKANIIAMIAKLMFTLASTFTRLSLISFYYRLVKDSSRNRYRWILHGSVVFVIAVCITFIFQTVFLCVPVQAYWNVYLSETGHCMDEGTITLSAGVINCIADLLTTILPIPIIVTLQMPLRQRFGVCLLLCLGFIVTIAGIGRTYFIWKSLVHSWDESWLSYYLWIAATVEIDLAVICACAPAWKSLLQQPIGLISSHLSLKLSYLRSPQSSQRSARSSLNNNEKKSKSGQHFSPGVTMNPSIPPSNIEAQTFGSNYILDPHHPLAENGMTSSSPPPLQIVKRQSIEQNSAYSSPRSTATRDSVDELMMPGQWFGDTSGKKKPSSRL